MKYFWDSFALVEITKNNSNYLPYSDEITVTTFFNLVELYYSILKDFNEEMAKNVYYKFKDCIQDVSDEIIFEAMKFRKIHTRKNLSYIDCIGYVFALKNNLKFLTGDKEFEGMENVEFVK